MTTTLHRLFTQRCTPWLLALTMSIGMAAPKASAAVSADITPNPVLAGEVFTLTVRQSPPGGGEPLLPSLPTGMRELQRSQSQSTQIINGQVSSTRSWQIQMLGQEPGEYQLQLPALDGESFAPLALKVQARDPQAKTNAEVFAQFISEDSQSWVGAEIRLRLQVYVAGELESGRLPNPELPGLLIEKVSEANDGEVLLGNTRYRVLDRQYVAFAESPGKLRIPGPVFSGQVVDRSRRSRFPSLSVPTRRVSAVAPDLVINVQPAQQRPDAQWLPASNVVLEDSLEGGGGQAQTQEALTRVIRLRVDGQLHTRLPALQWPRPDRNLAQTYSEDPQSQTGRRNDGGVSAEVIQRFVHIPQQSGELSLPGVRLPWFNTQTGRWEEAQLAPRRITVSPSLHQQSSTTQSPPAAPAQSPTSDSSSAQPLEVQTAPAEADDTAPALRLRLWQSAALAAFTGWLFTLLAGLLWLRRKPSGPEVSPGLGRASKLVAQALKAQDAAALARAMHIWGREQGYLQNQDHSSQSLLGLAQALDPHPLGHQLRQLSRHLYNQAGWSPQSFAQAWSQTPEHPRQAEQTSASALPELYPKST